mgnify:CR=1 FL=1
MVNLQIMEKSIPYQNVLAAKDILVLGDGVKKEEPVIEENKYSSRRPTYFRRRI